MKMNMESLGRTLDDVIEKLVLFDTTHNVPDAVWEGLARAVAYIDEQLYATDTTPQELEFNDEGESFADLDEEDQDEQ